MTASKWIGEGRTRLPQLVAAAVRGEEVVIDKAEAPQVRLATVDAERDAGLGSRSAKRQAGLGMWAARVDGAEIDVGSLKNDALWEEHHRRKSADLDRHVGNTKLLVFGLAALLATLCVSAAQATGQSAAQQAPPPGAVETIQDAIEALDRKQGHDKSVPAKVLGDAGAFFGPDSYPAEAIRNQQQGHSQVRVEIDARGFPTGCSTIESSGSSALDQATCRIAMTRMQFSAARDQKGKAIASQYSLSVRWILPTDREPHVDLSLGRVQIVDAVIAYDVSQDGKAVTCKVVRTPATGADLCAGFVPGRQDFPTATIDGHPSASTVTVETIVTAHRPDPPAAQP